MRKCHQKCHHLFSSLIQLQYQEVKAIFYHLLYIDTLYICVLLSPKQGKAIDYILERACFYSGDKSGDKFSINLKKRNEMENENKKAAAGDGKQITLEANAPLEVCGVCGRDRNTPLEFCGGCGLPKGGWRWAAQNEHP